MSDSGKTSSVDRYQERPDATFRRQRRIPVRSETSRGRPKRLQFITIAEVADLLSISDRTVRRWIKEGLLPAHHFGGLVRIAEADLQTFFVLHREP